MDEEDSLRQEVRRLEAELRKQKTCLKDEIAMHALQGWLASRSGDANHPAYLPNGCAIMARNAYALAEAMMLEREK